MMDRLKKRWGVASTRDVVVIFIVFSLAGSSILYVKRPLYRLLHVPSDLSLLVSLFLTIGIYQALLLAWGAVFGQFRFFWEKEKKLFRLLVRSVVPLHDF